MALRLVARGAITRGIIHRSRGATFLLEVRRHGIQVVPDGGDTVMRRVRFEVDDPEAIRLARRPGERSVDG
ncbi:MAG TPA: hypothetical protein VJU61_17740 [Polyangiaceae bacterium]|nr:hypothetical protein [Polyangiaceae bacterium]